MPSISGPSITSSGRVRQLARFFGVGFDERVDAVHERMAQARAHRQRRATLAPRLRRRLLALVALGNLEQAFGAVLAPVEHDILDALAQFGIEIIVDRQRAGVDDAHVHAGADRVVQEHRVDRLAHAVVAAERERDVGNAAGDMAMRQRRLDVARRLDEIDGVVVVLLDAGRDREDVRIEDDVFGRKCRRARSGCL